MGDTTGLFKQRSLNTRLLKAVHSGNLEDVRRLLANGAKPDTQCRESRLSVCHFAAFYGHGHVLEELVSKDADISVRDVKGTQPHHLAAFSTSPGAISCLNILLDKQERLLDSSVLLDRAVTIPKEEGLDSYLHNHKELTDVVENIEVGSTALYIAIKSGTTFNNSSSTAKVEDLLKRKATVNEEMVALAEKNNTDIFIMLNRAFHHPTTGPLQEAIMNGNVDQVETLLSLNEELPFKSLHLAIHHCQKNTNKSRTEDYNKIIQMLLEKNPKAINEKDEFNGKTPLYLAIEGGLEDVDFLLEKADLSIPCKDGETVIHLVARSGDSALLKYLLESLPTKNVLRKKDENQRTPLLSAISAGCVDCVQVLLETGVVETSVEDGSTLLNAAILSNKNKSNVLQKLVEYIIKNNVSALNHRNNEGLTAVDLATQLGEAKCLDVLLKCNEVQLKPDPNERRSTALHHAARNGVFLCMEKILDKCEELVDRKDEKELTPLIYAAHGRYPKCVELLLKKGANLGAKDTSNRTAIDIIMFSIPNAIKQIDDMLDSFIMPWKVEDQLTEVTIVPHKQDKNLQNNRCDSLEEKKVFLPNKISNNNDSKKSGEKQHAIRLDYKCLISGSRQLEVIEAVHDCKVGPLHHQFFLHPLVKTFLFLKWEKVKWFFWVLLAIHILYAICVIGLAITVHISSNPPLIILISSWLWRLGILVTFLPVFLVEIVSLLLMGKVHFGIKTCIKWMAILSTVVFLYMPDVTWSRFLASVTVLLAWIQLLLFYALSPTGGSYIQLFFKVAIKVFRVLSSFVFLLVGFGMSFFILFNARDPFPDIFHSLGEVVAMLSDLNYNDMMENYSGEPFLFRALSTVLYLTFYILAVVVMMNLIVGLSVSVVTEHQGQSIQLAMQGSFLSLVDKFYCYAETNRFLSRFKLNYLDVTDLIVSPTNQKGNSLEKDLLFEVMKSDLKKQFGPENVVRNIRKVNQKIQAVQDTLETQRPIKTSA